MKILELSEKIPKSVPANVINHQITKSGTSMYANYNAALRGRSKAEFYSKLCISVEEADETEMWIDLCISSKLIEHKFIHDLPKDSIELVKFLLACEKTFITS